MLNLLTSSEAPVGRNCIPGNVVMNSKRYRGLGFRVSPKSNFTLHPTPYTFAIQNPNPQDHKEKMTKGEARLDLAREYTGTLGVGFIGGLGFCI